MLKTSLRGIGTAFILLSMVVHGSSRPIRAQQNAFAGTVETASAASSALARDQAASEILSRMQAENQRRRERLQHLEEHRNGRGT
jgi:hypothetical protein